ncbi:MAG: 3-deoxy-7-phosphoheptulonate synthase, partial [Bacteroidota bacterium]
MTFHPIFPEPINRPVVIAGPCSAETEEQVLETAHQLVETNSRLTAAALQNSNGHGEQGSTQPMQVALFRAGIWKPRTRPDSFEGVGAPGLRWLKRVKEETGLPVTTEVANARHAFEALKYGIDVLWIGARTTVNPFSVQEIAEAIAGVDIPVLVKNPVNSDLELWIGALERLAKVGIKRLAVIHRGFANHSQTTYRNDPMWQIPLELMRRYPGLQIICDPSHICGNRHRLLSVAQKAMDLNYSGVMIETHPTPDSAWSDAKQ